jgi:hypothetical protein
VIALVCWLCKDDSLKLKLIPEAERASLRRKYNTISVLLVVLPAWAIFGTFDILAAEAAGIWVFGFYWYTKTGELKQAIEQEMKARRRPGVSSTRA